MLLNIKDQRKRLNRWKKVNAIIEATWHDNHISDADQAENDGVVVVEEKESISLREAIIWAEGFSENVTLFIYDEGAGIG